MIIYSPSSSKKTKKHLKVKTKRSPELDAEWQKLLAKHASPLEKGAKSKGIKVKVIKKAPESVVVLAKPKEPDIMRKMMGSTAPPASPKYTGTKIVGISTLHKSISTPVFSKEDAVDIAKMRRG